MVRERDRIQIATVVNGFDGIAEAPPCGNVGAQGDNNGMRQPMLDHLEHEVVQFYGALAEFTERDRPDILELPRDHPERIRRNMAFEGFLLHARLLDDFLGPKPDMDDDFWAGNIIDWTGASPLGTLPDIAGMSVRKRINKQLAHLTTARIGHQEVPIRPIHDAITGGLQNFVEQAFEVVGEDIWQINEWLYATWTTTQPPIQSGS